MKCTHCLFGGELVLQSFVSLPKFKSGADPGFSEGGSESGMSLEGWG